jgi:uncharacterized membrane protein
MEAIILVAVVIMIGAYLGYRFSKDDGFWLDMWD